MESQDARRTVQQAYARLDTGTRAAFSGNADAAQQYYKDYVEFVCAAAGGTSGSLLDVGVGNGWSTFAFAQKGVIATGVDLNNASFEPPDTSGLTLMEASAMDLPFENGSFDVVASYQCLEHVPDPEVALTEMLRVCRPGGLICIVGPNLVNPLAPVRALARAAYGKDPLPFRRAPETPRHPYGNTVGEVVAAAVRTAGMLVYKLVSRRAKFVMRDPDTRPPFVADNDACYLCTPIDLERFFTSRGCVLVQSAKRGRLQWTRYGYSGTWIAARKGYAGP